MNLAKRSLSALINLVLRLESEVVQLRAEIKELKGRLAKNSANSSKPPSTDGLQKPAPKSLRKKSGRKPGGQNGHQGRTLEQVAEPDYVKVLHLDRCPCGRCQGVSLREEPLIDYEKRQLFDLPAKLLEVTESRAEIKCCPISGILVRADFPEDLKAPAQYGARFKAMLSYFNTEEHLPFERLSRMAEEVFGQPLSEATVVGANQRIYIHLEPFEQQLAERLVREALLHFDESGFRVGAKLHWLHVACTDQLTFYGVHPKRGREAMDHFNILPRFEGWAMHDHFSPYLRYEQCVHVFCNEHHLRELKFQAEENGQAWAQEMSDFLLRQKHWRELHGLPSERRFKRILGQYHAILGKGRKDCPPRQGREARSKAANLLDRLADYDLCVLAFLLDLKVPFTNNQGERDIRMNKLRQKISGGFRTLHGAQVFARIRSYISTSRKQGRNILDALEHAFRGHPFMPIPTSGGP